MGRHGKPETSWHRYRRYLRQALMLPPHITWRKARRKMGNRLKRDVGRLRARLLGTDISDADFLRALNSRFPVIQAFLAHLAARKEPRFFLDSSRRHESVMAIRACCPDAEAFTVAAADQVCGHVFDLLGSGPTYLGERIDWHVDFKTGHRWDPRQYYADVRPASYPVGYDIKVPWELSRCQHFAWLGEAYWFTSDEKYAREFVAQVSDWIEQNPPQLGVNWACTMDVAIRAANWLWGYYFFKDSPSLTDEFRLTFFKSLLAHGRHIMNNLEWSETLTSNHYLSDIVGLVYLGILLPEFREAWRWREFGLQELEKEMFKQVYSDGVDFEASVSYHRLVAELFLSAVSLARLNGHTFSDTFMSRLEKMLEFVMDYIKPDGTVPLIGDADNGRLHRLNTWADSEREWIDHRYLLAIGAVLFERTDFAQAAGDQWEEAFWLLGEQAIVFKEQFDKKDLPPPRLASRAFPHGGIYVMRCDDSYMIIDAGPNGQNGYGGHAHNDTLSFELFTHGRSFLVDSGAYIYTGDPEWRNKFRSTSYHNTVVVDGAEINDIDPKQLFLLGTEDKPKVNRWKSLQEYDFLDAEHNGYERLPDPVIHRRQIYFNKQEGYWIIRDLLEGCAGHKVDLYYHFDAGIDLTVDEDLAIRTTVPHGANLLLKPLNSEGLRVEIVEGWVSKSYGIKEEAKVVKFSGFFQLPRTFMTLVYPFHRFDERLVAQLEGIPIEAMR